MKAQIQRLSSEHDRTQFDCGEPALNLWLAQQSLQQQQRRQSRTFVLVDIERPEIILAYYTLTISEVDGSSYPSRKSQPRRLPVIRLGRLAVAKALQKSGIGEFLLMNAIERANEVSNNGGGVALAVDAKNEQAAAFYRRYDFTPAPDAPLLLFLPLGDHLAIYRGPMRRGRRPPQSTRPRVSKPRYNASNRALPVARKRWKLHSPSPSLAAYSGLKT